jgi:hypothetical protein
MKRRQPRVTTPVNFRLDTELVDRLTTHAKANRVTFSAEAKARLLSSFDTKPELSLYEFRSSWLGLLRDAIEAGVPKQEIEAGWRVLLFIEAEWAKFCGAIEGKLSASEGKLPPCVRIPRVRELLRGAPSLPDETKARSKATPQE